MSLQPSKYKVLTKQVYNHIKDESGKDEFEINYVYNFISTDELLGLLLKNLTAKEKFEVSFMVSLYSKNDDLDFSVSEVMNNLILIYLISYEDLSYRNERCEECDDGYVNCHMCDGDGEIETYDGDYETCGNCFDGLLYCDECDGTGEIESSEEFYLENQIEVYTLNNSLTNLPKRSFLTKEDINRIFNSEPNYIRHKVVNDRVRQEEPQQYFDGTIDDKYGEIMVVTNIQKLN